MLRRLGFALGCASIVLALLALTSCGGSAAGAGTDAGTPVTPPVEEPGFDPQLDPDLQARAAGANAAPALAPPPQDPAMVALGRALFFDKVLSGNRDVSCKTCHDPSFGTGDALSVSIGAGGIGEGSGRRLSDGRLIARNAPPLFSLARQPSMFWDSRVRRLQNGALVTPEPALNGATPAAGAIASQLTTALAAQAMFPVASPDEMRGQPGENEIADASSNLEVWALLMRRLVGTDDDVAPGIAEYRTMFAAAYPNVATWEDFNFGHAARAIAAFEVSAFETRGSPFDAWLGGDAGALSATEKRGGILFFGRADCSRCHRGAPLTDGQHHAIGVPQVGPGKDFAFEDTGRALVTGDPDDRYRFRTPSLRNVALTGPWMHDGAYTTLEAAVRHYIDPEDSLRTYDANQLAPFLRPLVDRDPARQNARADAIDGIVRDGVRLDPTEVAELAAFLRALSDDVSPLAGVTPSRVPSGLPIGD